MPRTSSLRDWRRDVSDERLVALVRAGDERAFEAIFQRYRGPLLRYCRRMLPAFEAEEAVQETLLHAYRGIRVGQRHLHLRPWLYRIALNVSLDTRRREPVDWRILAVGLLEADAPTSILQRREDLGEVLRALEGLPARQREALVLQALEGRRYDEIAAHLGVSDQAVRQLLNRARRTLRETHGRARVGAAERAERRREERRGAQDGDRRRGPGCGGRAHGERRRGERRRSERRRHGASA